MTNEQILRILKSHADDVDSVATELYKSRLKSVITNLEDGLYIQNEDNLVHDLQSLGFQDLALEVRRGMYR